MRGQGISSAQVADEDDVMKMSKISWTDHTFNPWMGCSKVSAGCKNCYAEAMMDTYYGRVKWGPKGTRVRTSKAYWKEPKKWNSEMWVQCDDCRWRGEEHDLLDNTCPKCGGDYSYTRQRVFCASLSDVFEISPFVPGEWSIELWDLIEQTPNLDWLLLTKRPENISTVPDCQHIMLGISAEDQGNLNRRWDALNVPRLRKFRKFLSAEPLLGPLDLSRANALNVDWVIVGGESGPAARPMILDWARDIRAQCARFDIPFFFKQVGGRGRDKGGDLLDGRTWKEFP
jgi:protein gp37